MKGGLSYFCVSQTMSVPAEKGKAGAHRKGGPVLMRVRRHKLCVRTRESYLWKGAHFGIQYLQCSAELESRWVWREESLDVRRWGRCGFCFFVSSTAVWFVCDPLNCIQTALLTFLWWPFPTKVCSKVGSVCLYVSVCGWINPLLKRSCHRGKASSGNCLCTGSVTLYALIHCVLSPFCSHMFDFWPSYKSYCLDCDKLWETTTVVWYCIVARCGLSGHLWHGKYVKYVGVWSLFCPSLFSSCLLYPIHSLKFPHIPDFRE